MSEDKYGELYSAVELAIKLLPDTSTNFEIVAGSSYRLPPRDHMLPPFISTVASLWDMDAKQRESLVRDECATYERDLQRRMTEDRCHCLVFPSGELKQIFRGYVQMNWWL